MNDVFINMYNVLNDFQYMKKFLGVTNDHVVRKYVLRTRHGFVSDASVFSLQGSQAFCAHSVLVSRGLQAPQDCRG